MNARFLTIPLFALALASCDKAKKLADQATSTVKQQIAAQTGGKESSKVDEALQKLVDQTPEGVVFRKDLPFPTRLEITTTRSRNIDVRLYQSSAIEKRVDTLKGTQLIVFKLERSGDHVRYTRQQSDFTIPVADGSDGETKKIANPLEQVAPVIKPVTFIKSGKKWETAESDGFQAAVLSKVLTPVLDGLLVESALAPRPLWFAKHRFKIGDELDVTGDLLPMLLAGQGKGSFHLKLEAIEAVGGHPCGVFSVTGDFSRKQFPDFEGNLTDEEVSIQSGKLWLSLLYPIVLKEEYDSIQTFKSGGNGGLAGRGQGSIKHSVKRDWKSLDP